MVKFLYISRGNIPSKWAHSIMTMKMSESLSKYVPNFKLLMSTNFYDLFFNRIDIWKWYGIEKPFKVLRLPIWVYRKEPIFEEVCPGRYFKMVRLLLKFIKPKIVFTQKIDIALSCLKDGLNVIIETHLYPSNSNISIFKKISCYRKLKGIITISEILKQAYINLGIPEEKIFVYPDAVDLEVFVKRTREKKEARKITGLDRDSFIAVYCGNLYENRGIEQILESARILPDVQFVLVGGWDKDVKKWKVKASNLINIKFIGFVENYNVPLYLSAADVLLMPYSRKCETAQWMSPIKLFEYMASKRPIIATDFHVLHKHLEHGRNALFVQPDDSYELAKAIENIMSDPAYGERLGHAAYTDVQPYTWDKRVKAILSHFSQEINAFSTKNNV